MKTKSLMIIIALFALVMGMTASAYAATLSFESKGNGVVDVKVDQALGIAGAAFTVKYDTNSLIMYDVTSSFFETFATQKTLATNWTGDTQVVVDGTTYTQPLMDGNEITGKGMPIAAARLNASTTAGSATLFTLTFQRKTGVTATTFPISIIATTLSNTLAGYSASGETINLLIGADANQPITNPTSAFPVILAKTTDSAYTFASGNASFSTVTRPDINGDGTVDGRDALKIIRCLMGLDVGCNLGNGDVNSDNTVDGRDALKIVRCLMGLDTTGCGFTQ